MRWNWGVPGWHDAEAYQRTRSDREWRWAFLRRRPDYREAWLFVSPARNLDPRPEFRWPKYGGRELLARFAIMPLIDPSRQSSDWELMFCFQMQTQCLVRRISEENQEKMERRGQVLVPFDLNDPIEPQVREARRILKVFQENLRGGTLQRRQRRELWPDYLRVIDARDAGATWAAIGQEVLGVCANAAQRARDTWQQAFETAYGITGRLKSDSQP